MNLAAGIRCRLDVTSNGISNNNGNDHERINMHGHERMRGGANGNVCPVRQTRR